MNESIEAVFNKYKNKNNLIRCDLGCGPWKMPGFIGIDCVKSWDFEDKPSLPCEADIICDLNKGIPFKDNTANEIYCSHFLEHCEDPKFMLKEIHRVCVNGSKVLIKVPLFELRFKETGGADKFIVSKDCFPIQTREPVIMLASSHDHITAFFPTWFEKNKISGFKIVSKTIIPKITNDAKDMIFEMTLELKVVK